jgi:exonuclease VII large subunit
MRSGLDQSRSAFEGLGRLLHSLSPLAVIGRGYAAAFDERGRLVQNARDLGVGDEFSLALREGGVECSVLSKTPRHVPAALREHAGDRVDECGEKTLESGFEEADRG